MNIKTEYIDINAIPAINWGDFTGNTILAVHGLMSHKADIDIRLLAENAVPKGYQIISIDLPEHGERKDSAKLNPWTCTEELCSVYDTLATNSRSIGLYGCSIGAYMSMMALAEKDIVHSMFLSPVVDMKFLIEGLMASFNITSEQLQTKKYISLPNGQFLDWSYYSYVCAHPICWNTPTDILWGFEDNLIPEDVIDQFSIQSSSRVTKVESEHFFHTPKQLAFYGHWLDDKL
ncbi:alpha/beta hydrolase [Oscillospiraceae bacterium LTW-04]|nr:alpha/beta hydrolase [Oscillospiraceae bacterium MB24-C1]